MNVLALLPEIISIHTNAPEYAYHMTIHVHGACMSCCKQEAVYCTSGCLVEENTTNDEQQWQKSQDQTRDFFAWTGEVKLLLKVTHAYKAVNASSQKANMATYYSGAGSIIRRRRKP